MRRRPASPKRLPAYALYGEPHRGSLAAPDHLHCESIAERSRLHGWEIRPHHHDALFQLLLIEHGAAQVLLEGRQHLLQGPAVVAVPALAAHGFRFAPAVQGLVFTIAEQHLAALLQPHGGLREAVMCARAAPLPPADASLQAAAATLRDEALGSAPWRAAALDAGLLRLAVALARLAAPDLRAAVPLLPPRAQAHVQRLRALVEAQYRQQPTVAALAAQLGITPTQLNRACRQVLGHPALAVLHGRLLQQAQRELAYTNLSVKQIGIELGFSDAAYFTRFFRRHGGHTPSGWRAACVRL